MNRLIELAERCGGCRFFVKHEPQHTYGDCHRLPPTFEMSPSFQEGNYGQRVTVNVHKPRNGVWPNIAQDEWCGEFQVAATRRQEGEEG